MDRPDTGPDDVVVTAGLTKVYGADTVVDDLCLRIRAGEVHALLGPNGSGKTTTVRMLATLLRPDRGHARRAGLDTVTRAAEVRTRIGLVGQFASLDPRLTAVENLVMFGRLAGLPKRAATRRAHDLLDAFELTAAADRAVRTYSGGMRRRVDLLASLVVQPAVLFLDEPSTGLDPRSRDAIHAEVRRFAAAGTAVLLTTQYLDEADPLAGRLTILDHGVTIATGSPDEVKRRVGSGLEIVVADARRAGDTATVVAPFGLRPVAAGVDDPGGSQDATRLGFTADAAVPPLLDLHRALEDAGIRVSSIGERRVSLDEAFLALTGGAATESAHHTTGGTTR